MKKCFGAVVALSFAVGGCSSEDPEYIAVDLQNPADGKTDFAWGHTYQVAGGVPVHADSLPSKQGIWEYEAEADVVEHGWFETKVQSPTFVIPAQNNTIWTAEILSPTDLDRFTTPLRFVMRYRVAGSGWRSLTFKQRIAIGEWDSGIELPIANYFYSVKIDMEKDEVIVNNELVFFGVPVKEKGFEADLVEFAILAFPMYDLYKLDMKGSYPFMIRAHCEHGCDATRPLPDIEASRVVVHRDSFQVEFCNAGQALSPEKFGIQLWNLSGEESVHTQPRFDVPPPGQCAKTGTISCSKLGAGDCSELGKVMIETDYTRAVLERHEDNNRAYIDVPD